MAETQSQAPWKELDTVRETVQGITELSGEERQTLEQVKKQT